MYGSLDFWKNFLEKYGFPGNNPCDFHHIVRLPLKAVSVTYRGNGGYYRGKIHPFGLDSGFPFDYRGNLKMKFLKRVVSQRGLNDLFRMMENLDSTPCEIHLIIEEIGEL